MGKFKVTERRWHVQSDARRSGGMMPILLDRKGRMLPMSFILRLFLLGLGWTMVGIGIAGIFLPLLPTTPFLLLAAWLFSRASPRLEQWLFDHPLFGQALRDWRQSGAISRRAKIAALMLMGLGLVLLWWRQEPSPLVAGAVTAIVLACGLFIASRPEPRR